MNTVSTCPDPASLQEYLLGRLSDASATAMETHLATCPECRRLLPTIQAEDDFVADFRTMARRPQPKNTHLDRLASDLHGMIPRLPIVQHATPPIDAEATPAGAEPDADEEARSLLAPPQQPDEMGRLGEYRVLKVLGSGGMGVVFLAEDTKLRRRVALKAMKPALAANARARQRFLREAQLTASLTHDHVVAVHQVGEERGVPFLAMPLLQGESLDARLKREGRLPTAEVVQIGRETAEGLAAAHERGLIHRDVKPANLWLETMPGGRTRVKVLDFGLARATDSEAPLTQSGVIVGTPSYMAPEQVDGCVDCRADLFSLGCVLYRMTTGQPPFPGETVLQVLARAAAVPPRPPRELNPETPPGLSDLILRLLAKDPGDRPQQAQDVAELLRRIEQEHASVTDQAPAAAAPRRRRVSARIVCLVGLLGLGLAAVAAVIVVKVRTPDGKETQVTAPTGSKVDVDAKGNVTVALPGDAPAAFPDEITNSIGMKLKLIQAGTFLMGSPKDEEGRDGSREGSQHEVEITRAFYMGAYPVTKGQFAAFVQDAHYQTDAETDGNGGYGYNPVTRTWEGRDPKYTWRNSGWVQTDAHPVVEVSWNDAVRFCAWLSKKEGRLYQLPTEAEWEYACRAGTTTRFWCGDAADSLKGNANLADASAREKYTTAFAPAAWDDGYPFTSPVGKFNPNPWGLYDMSGNVWQWCADRYGNYQGGFVKDPTGPDNGDSRILRGGAFNSPPCDFRSAARGIGEPGMRSYNDGFRVVLRVDATQPPPMQGTDAKPEPARAAAPFDAAKARQFQQAWADYLGVPLVREADLGGGVKMELKLIPPGTFQMGSPEGEAGRWEGEEVQHDVEITRPFYLGVYPVTKGQFAAFVKDDGYQTEAEKGGKGWGYNASTKTFEFGPKYSWRDPGFTQTDDHPVVVLTWNDAQRFCAWLGQKEGNTYELPTEAEWEYACRAGTTTHFWCGDADESLKGNANIADASLKGMYSGATWAVSWDDGYPFTSPVGSFKANPWGLNDMGGNVGQWCADWFGPYRGGSVKDPKGDDSGERRIWRGGSWNGSWGNCRSAARRSFDPAYRVSDVGFRVVLRLPASHRPPRVGDVAKPPDDDAWLKHVTALPAAQQVDAVAAELKAHNPGFDGNVTPTIESGLVVGLSFNTYKVTDISPVRALPGLRVLNCASGPERGWLADLSPLQGMKLTDLDCESTQVSDLSPLKDMKLRSLNLAHTRVWDLTPLRDMKLTYLCCYDTQVSDLTPLKDMKLTTLLADVTRVSDLTPLKDMSLTVLHFGTSAVSDLTPLKDMNLTELNCGSTAVRDLMLLKHMKITDLNFANTKVSDLTPLADMKLTHLDCSGAPVADLSPLKDMKITDLNLENTRVSDLSPLKDMKLRSLNIARTQVGDLTLLRDMPLTYLNCWGTRVSDLSPVKNMKLTTLNCGVTSVSDLSSVKNMELTDLNCGTTAIFDLSPLRHMKLTDLNCSYTKVPDLTPLADMKLTHLDCSGAPVSDLSPLKDMPLTRLDCENTRVSDLSALKGMPLTELRCPFKAERDAAIVRCIKTLETINGKPAAEFWKDVNDRNREN